MNSDHYLVLGNQVTDYKISSSDILTQTGGMVETLSVSALIFLLMLCLTAAPLMSIFRGIIPWFKKQLKSIQKQLSRT
jgi:ABC-type amino acid transport system permease subunit